MAQPFPITITDSTGHALTVSGATPGTYLTNPFPCVLCDANGNALNLGQTTPNVVFNDTSLFNATSSAKEQLFTPTAQGRYRITATIYTSVLDASGATAVIRVKTNNNGSAQGAATGAVGLTTLSQSQGQCFGAVVNTATFTNANMGYTVTVTGTPAAGFFAVNFTVEYLGA